MRGCRHHWTCSRFTDDGDPAIIQCSRCGEYWSLGPASDDSEAVRIEMRAAEIVAARGPRGFVRRMRGSPTLFEEHGFNCVSTDESCLSFHWTEHEAGYLARCIHDHDGEQDGGGE